MDVKTESKILLTALAVAPTVLGIVLAVSGEAVLGGLDPFPARGHVGGLDHRVDRDGVASLGQSGTGRDADFGVQVVEDFE